MNATSTLELFEKALQENDHAALLVFVREIGDELTRDRSRNLTKLLQGMRALEERHPHHLLLLRVLSNMISAARDAIQRRELHSGHIEFLQDHLLDKLFQLLSVKPYTLHELAKVDPAERTREELERLLTLCELSGLLEKTGMRNLISLTARGHRLAERVMMNS